MSRATISVVSLPLKTACLLSVLALAPLGVAFAEAEVVGAYSNRVVTDVRAQGYGVQLWRDGERYFGFFLNSAGMAEDIPLGVLEELHFDPAARTLSFKARLSVSKTTSDGENWVPTRDLYRFDGTLFPDQISGELSHSDPAQPDKPGSSETVKLYRAREEEAALPKFRNYQQWADLAKKLIATRGPQW
jgi:hypothetical protein